MSKRYAGDFDPATPVIEICRYSNAVERIKELEAFIRRYRYSMKGGETMQNAITRLLDTNTCTN